MVRVPDVTVVLPPECRSPVRHLLPMVARSMATIAPERLEDLKAACCGLRVAFIEDFAWRCSYGSTDATITMSTGTVEVCWAAAHAYVTLYDRVLADAVESKPRTIDLTADPIVKSAMDLLKWAFEKYVNGAGAPWPQGLLHPKEQPELGSAENVADELALCATAYVIHHELAHHRLGHRAQPDPGLSIEQERDADYAAADWILEGVGNDRPRFTKRALGVATALALLTAHGIHSGEHGGETHPRNFDRLIHTLERAVLDDYDRVWGFVVGILNLHLNSIGIVPPAVVHDSFKTCVDSYVELIAASANPSG